MNRITPLVWFIGCLALTATASAQVRKLHTRDLTRLSQVQTADYLTRNDVIFIPIGAVETNGIMPSDRDYVFPLAFAMAMAENADALYMPGLMWSYPGTTLVAPSTIYISPSVGAAHLKTLAKSLLRQGFRRQVWLAYGQGPATLTGGTLAREFFDETQVPILFVDLDHYLPRVKPSVDFKTKALYGSHYMTGRIEDLPLKGDYGPSESRAAGEIPVNVGLAALSKLGFAGSLALGSWIPDLMAHGGNAKLPETAAEREEWGKQGADEMRAVVSRMKLTEAMAALREHDKFTQEVIIPKLGKFMVAPSDHR